MTAVLMAVVVTRALSQTEGVRWSEVAAALSVTVVYLLGTSRLVGTDRARGIWWLIVLVAAWCWLLWLVPEGVFLAFPLYFLAGHLLPDRVAMVAVGMLAFIAIAGFSVHRGLSFPVVLGPALGAVVALATVLGLRAVDRESERRGVLEERERLAREIHDTLAQGLSSINLLLGAASERMPADVAHGPVGDLVREARTVAVANLAEARRFVRALSPVVLEGTPLVQALERTVQEFPGASLSVDGQVRALPASHEIALVRITREALTNARKHAQATRVAISLSFQDDQMTLDIVDDGRGFDPTAASSGFGLASMRARAVELGGQLHVESSPGEGTAIAVALPTTGGVA